MGICGKNCYGKTIEDLDAAMKDNLPLMLLNFLLGLSRCTNSNSLRNSLANWNAYNIYTASKVRNSYKSTVLSGKTFDINDALNYNDNTLNDWTNDFNNSICNGYGKTLTDLDNKYNGNSNNNAALWPSDLTDDQKQAIRDKINNNNAYNDNTINDNSNNIIGIDKDDYNNYDGINKDNLKDIFDNTGNPILNIPIYELDDLNNDAVKRYSCFDPIFQLENYLYINTKTTPLITNAKVNNIKRIHNEILLPIYNYYFGETTEASCQIRITFGLGSLSDTVVIPAGSSFSSHLKGMAIDFTIAGVSSDKFISDIESGRLLINFGVLSPTNNLHITLPYTYEGYEISNMIIKSPAKAKSSLEVQFI